MFGTRGAVGGAAASFHLRRAHAGAETREELEALPDRVLDAVVAEARELDDRRAAETLDRRNADAANPNEGDDPEGGGLPAPNPTAEAALDLRETEEDEDAAEARLARDRAEREIRRRADLARDILAARARRRDGAIRRRCVSISRAPWCGGLGGSEEDGGAGSTNSTTIPIDLDDFSRFVHRGLDAEGIDAKETERLYARCLRGRDGSRRAVSDVLDADHLERVVRDGAWDKHWAKFVSEARQKAAERGVSAAAMAVFGATASDPIRAGVVPGLSSPLAALADSLAGDDDRDDAEPTRAPEVARPSAFARNYFLFLLRFLTLPAIAPFGMGPRRFAGHAQAAFLTRFLLPRPMRRWRWPGAAALPIAFFLAPAWCLGAATLFMYAAYRPEFLAADVFVPTVATLWLASLAAACTADAIRAGACEHPHRLEQAQLRPSHAFPGGRAKVPDDDARIVQRHPRLDSGFAAAAAAAAGGGGGQGAARGRERRRGNAEAAEEGRGEERRVRTRARRFFRGRRFVSARFRRERGRRARGGGASWTTLGGVCAWPPAPGERHRARRRPSRRAAAENAGTRRRASSRGGGGGVGVGARGRVRYGFGDVRRGSSRARRRVGADGRGGSRGRNARAGARRARPAPSSRARAVDLDAPLAEGPPPLGGPSSGGGGGAAFGSGFGGAAAFGGYPGAAGRGRRTGRG